MAILDLFAGNPSQETIFTVAVIIGMVGHYAKKRVKLETRVTLKQWFLEFNVFGTITSVVSALIAILGAFVNHLITPEMNPMTVFYIGLITGFTIDSVTNSDGFASPQATEKNIKK
jgi:hypothetical protein